MSARRDGLWQKKSLGQVFLIETWPAEKVVEVIQDNDVNRVLEIGPGGGVLTRLLVRAGMNVTAVEKDDRFAEKLAGQAKQMTEKQGKLEVVNEDVLTFNLVKWIEEQSQPVAVVGNIPYNISTPILRETLKVLNNLVCAVFMTQFEFANRLVAVPSTKTYGSLSVYAQMRSDLKMECKVERECFKPVPKVDSAIITLKPKSDILSDKELKWVETVCRTAIAQRRKKLNNAVKQLLSGLNKDECPIDLNRRPDTLSPEEYTQLASFLKK